MIGICKSLDMATIPILFEIWIPGWEAEGKDVSFQK
jgi:hypothetical protein